MFINMNPKARLTFAEHFKLLKTWSNFSSPHFALRLSVAKLKTLCLARSSSAFTRKCCHERNSCLRFASSTPLMISAGPTFLTHIALSKRQVVTTKRKNHLLFVELSPLITNYQTRIWAKKGKKPSICGRTFPAFHWLILLTRKSVPVSFCTLSV